MTHNLPPNGPPPASSETLLRSPFAGQTGSGSPISNPTSWTSLKLPSLPMTINTDIIAASAAVIGLVVSALSALAAFRSADSARSAQASAERADRRLRIFDISRTSADTRIELLRVEARAEQAQIGYDTLGVFSGSFENSGIEESKVRVARKRKLAEEHLARVSKFSDANSKLADATDQELDRICLIVTTCCAEVRALREELDGEVARIDGQTAPYRNRRISRQ